MADIMVVFVARIITSTAHRATVDLNRWHHAIHQVTGDIALRFNKATAADLDRWAKLLRKVAEEMEAVVSYTTPAEPATPPDDARRKANVRTQRYRERLRNVRFRGLSGE